MKKISLSIIALLLLIAIGCTKDNLDKYKSITLNPEIEESDSFGSQIISNVKNDGDILHFKDMESFKIAYKTLEEFQNNETKGKTLKYSEKDENNKIAFKYANDGYIELTSRSNDVEITNILFNRGNCKMESKNLTRALKERGSFKIAFGTKIPIRFYCIGSDLIEVTVATEFGDFVYDIE